MTGNEVIKKRGFEEEFPCFEKEIKDFFGDYKNKSGGEESLEVWLVRSGYRIALKAKAEIERLTVLAKLGNMRANDYRAMRNKYNTAKTEAYKEFAERLKTRFIADSLQTTIDEVLEEMESERE